MTAYTLADAVTDIKRRLPWATKTVLRQPLNGLIDGTNKVFYLATPPAVDSSVTIYDASGSTVSPSSVDEDDGVVIFSAAPTAPYTASYTHTALKDGDWTNLCYDGFSLMETLLSRGWYLYDDAGTVYISSDDDAATDPVISGTMTFSTSTVQKRFYIDCCYVAWVMSMWTEAANSAMSIREERVGGLQVSRERQPDAWAKILEQAEGALEESAAAAADEAGLLSTLIEGGAVAGARSDYHYYVLDWWRNGLQDRGSIA
jgi:hypothetical protein